MELKEIQTYLNSPNPKNRMKAIVELRNHEPSEVVPLLQQRMYDKEFIVRSFVAMGLGYKQTEEGYQSLIDLIENEKDPNVKAEAANSLSKYGEKSVPHLIKLFETESHWLVRQSIFAAIEGMDTPEITLQLSRWGLQGNDLVVKLVSVGNLAKLCGTEYENEAVDLLFDLSAHKKVQMRIKAAKTLALFDHPKAKTALAELQYDQDHRVVAATLENIIKK